MTRFGWLITSIIMIVSAVVLLVVVLVTSRHHVATLPAPTPENSVSLLDPSTLAIYSSGTYGFSFFYPATAAVTDQFSTSTNDGLVWRENPIATGTLIARVQVDGGEVRIGTSAATKALSSCVKPGSAEQILPNMSIGSTTWKAFAFDKLGTDIEQHVTSYRVLHNNACFALETFEPRAQVSTTTMSTLESIVQSFTFAHSS